MPYYHCRSCDHEWEGCRAYFEEKCDWCDADKPKILESKTPLEKLGSVLIFTKDDPNEWTEMSYGKRLLDKLKNYVESPIKPKPKR